MAGVSGSESVTGRVVGIAATAGDSPASIVISGGDAITIPAGLAIAFAPRGILRDSTITFDTTTSYVVEYLT